MTHLIWDFDGTLYDTYPQMTHAMQATLRGFGREIDGAEARALMKKTVFYAFGVYAERFGLDRLALQKAFFEEHSRVSRFIPMAGMAECLRATLALGCRHYLFTHRDNGAIRQLTADGLSDCFTDTVTREDGFADKPAPDAILHLIQKHGMVPAQTFMIGDREIDVLSGHAAGTNGILFDPDGYEPAVTAEYRVRSMAEITAIVRALHAREG
ncbi:MAG TPA: HAD-IA family hydrolase [Candidatus Limiplasma sp.]|nr:HAD-IA family hydrolase [Candidatus Limiplasma sp.]HPS80564.1 HAD-IA family hydrolase [Candidatus Limiplasma sp.]